MITLGAVKRELGPHLSYALARVSLELQTEFNNALQEYTMQVCRDFHVMPDQLEQVDPETDLSDAAEEHFKRLKAIKEEVLLALAREFPIGALVEGDVVGGGHRRKGIIKERNDDGRTVTIDALGGTKRLFLFLDSLVVISEDELNDEERGYLGDSRWRAWTRYDTGAAVRTRTKDGAMGKLGIYAGSHGSHRGVDIKIIYHNGFHTGGTWTWHRIERVEFLPDHFLSDEELAQVEDLRALNSR